MTDAGAGDPGAWYRPAAIHLADYDPGWPQRYAAEAARIAAALGEDLVATEHVGSTAIPGMPAKPILDILAAVASWDGFDEIVATLDRIGYLYTPESEADDPERRVFRRGPADMRLMRTHHLHVTAPRSRYWTRIIGFRDHLREDAADAAEYAALKRRLATEFATDGRAYTRAKGEFVQRIESRGRSPLAVRSLGPRSAPGASGGGKMRAVPTPLRSRRLVPGDTVRLVSPASTPDPAWVEESVEILEGWGLVVEVGEHALDDTGLYAGADAHRLADVNDALRDPAVRAIVTTRGGAGAYRIVDDLDFHAAASDPKPIVGFSDISFLHLALWHHCRLIGIHGCLAGDTARTTVRQLLMTTDPLTTTADPNLVTAAVRVPGRAAGPLVGGNLAAVATSVGVRLSGLEGAILFIEDVRTKGLGLVDRWLTQLRRSGAVDRIAGVVGGSFEGYRDVIDRKTTIVDVLGEHLGALGVPILGGIRAGHDLIGADRGPDQTAIPIGATATIDATTGVLTIEPCVHE
jgi:muramoyltetrapeptide carboxypeptidase